MIQSRSRNRLAILDGLVRYHVEKFVELEARRIQLHARNLNRPGVLQPRMSWADRPSLLTEIEALEERLATLKANL